jgi:hypothetical protein
MNAEIFFHPKDESKLQAIAEILAKRIYPGIKVSRLQAGDFDKIWGAGYEQAGRYVQLLLAATPPDREFALGVTQLYYGWYLYSSYFGQYREFQGSRSSVLFPAVAVNDRMVLVPEQLVPRLTGSEGLSLFRPLEAGGLVEVDFDQPELLDKAAQKVGDVLRAEAVQMVRRYATYRPHADLNIDEAAKELGLDVPFVEDALKQQAGKHSFYGELTCEFSRTSFPMKRWTRATIKIANASDVGLHNLAVDIRGPVRIRPDRVETDVPAHGAAQIDVAIQPEDEGEFPIEVVFTLAEDRSLRDWLPKTDVWLTAGSDA